MYQKPFSPTPHPRKTAIPRSASSFMPFCFYKLARDSGIGLPGATFELKSPDGAVLTGVSSADGLIYFTVEACVEYVLTEMTPPDGYAATGAQFTILVDMCGRLFVDGQCTMQFAVYNEPALFAYTVNYYANSITPSNLLGTVTGSGPIGEYIYADLTLFAPSGYIVPGVRSGAVYITAVPADNVVSVVYSNPIVITGDAVNILANSATINNNTFSGISGTIYSVSVQYSTSAAFTSVTTVTGTISSPYSVNLTGLQQNTTYYYRASVSASSGQFVGEIKSFTTAQLV